MVKKIVFLICAGLLSTVCCQTDINVVNVSFDDVTHPLVSCESKQSNVEFTQIICFVCVAVPGLFLNALSFLIFRRLLQSASRRRGPNGSDSPFLVCLLLLAFCESFFCVTVLVFYGFLLDRAITGRLHCLILSSDHLSKQLSAIWVTSLLQCAVFLVQDQRNWWLVAMTALRCAALVSPLQARHRITLSRIKLLFCANFLLWATINLSWFAYTIEDLMKLARVAKLKNMTEGGLQNLGENTKNKSDIIAISESLMRKFNLLALQFDEATHKSTMSHNMLHAILATLAPAAIIVSLSVVVLVVLHKRSGHRMSEQQEQQQNNNHNCSTTTSVAGSSHGTRKEAAATKIIILVAASFCLCQLPLAVLAPPLFVRGSADFIAAFGYAVMLSYLEFLSNFFILALFSPPFRSTMFTILLCRKSSSSSRFTQKSLYHARGSTGSTDETRFSMGRLVASQHQ